MRFMSTGKDISWTYWSSCKSFSLTNIKGRIQNWSVFLWLHKILKSMLTVCKHRMPQVISAAGKWSHSSPRTIFCYHVSIPLQLVVFSFALFRIDPPYNLLPNKACQTDHEPWYRRKSDKMHASGFSKDYRRKRKKIQYNNEGSCALSFPGWLDYTYY